MREDLTQSIITYRDVVFRVALGYVKNIHDADDVVQNVFMKLGGYKKNFPSCEDEKAWLIRVTINESKDLLKSVWHNNRTGLDESLVASYAENSYSSGVYEYVKKLKPKYRTVIYLHYYEGYSTKEIAGILKMSQTAVTTQLNRARNQLRENILKDEKEDNFYGNLQGFI
ncbi:MAG: RNA polymerase sigma factor [Oscillospiraceae bacterium]|nr:RNA polymerase sigma factor [Oscillospiraceae bacterium]